MTILGQRNNNIFRFVFLFAVVSAIVVVVLTLGNAIGVVSVQVSGETLGFTLFVLGAVGAVAFSALWYLEQERIETERQLGEFLTAVEQAHITSRFEELEQNWETPQLNVFARTIAKYLILNRDAKAEMEKLSRIRSEFLGNVSHELRTPIFSIQGYLETLLDGAVDDPNVARSFLNKAQTNATRLNNLLADLIDISRIESGELKMSFRFFNLIEIAKEAIINVEFVSDARDISISFSPPAQELFVFGDKERLSQVLINLLENAVKYNHQGGSITVTIEKQSGSMVFVTVVDTGVGIPEDAVGRIFERFYRVDKNRSRDVGGTGLGLAIVKHILDAHGSAVSVHSEVGKGTSIGFALRTNEFLE